MSVECFFSTNPRRRRKKRRRRSNVGQVRFINDPPAASSWRNTVWPSCSTSEPPCRVGCMMLSRLGELALAAR